MPKSNITFLVIICFALPFNAFAGEEKTDLQNERLKGKVKSCTTYNHEINSPKFLKVFNSEIKQDINTTFYNTKGYRTKMMYSIVDKNDKVIRYFSRTYDTKNRQTKSSEVHKTVYNNIGKRDSVFGVNKAGKLTLIDVFQYDKKNNLVIAYRYINDNEIYIGKKVYKVLYKYDKFDNLIEEIDLGKKGERVSKKSYQYDSRGNILLEIDSAVMRIGNENMLTKNKNDIYTVSYTYKNFDRADNWLQQTTVVNNERSYSTTRIIKYYN